MWEKLKRFIEQDTWCYAGLLCLCSLLSFGLGRQSVLENSVTVVPADTSRIMITRHDTHAPQPAAAPVGEGSDVAVAVVASRSGTRYHYTHCPGAKQIKRENRLEFASPSAAEAAGYTLAANCTPLGS